MTFEDKKELIENKEYVVFEELGISLSKTNKKIRLWKMNRLNMLDFGFAL